MFTFRTQFDDQKPIYSCAGDKDKILYAGRYDEKGRIVLDEVGKEDVYASIQSHKDGVDLHVLMKRFANGDVEALSQRQGFYGDVLDFPKTYAEALNHMHDMERQFMSLPADVRNNFGNSFSEFLAASADKDFMERCGVKPAIPEVEKDVIKKGVVSE